jgi:hypothetical protein
MGVGVEIEMARSEAEPGAGRDRGDIGQHAVGEPECLDRAGIFRPVRFGIVAARHQRYDLVGRRGEDLMSVNAGIEARRLGDHSANRAVGMKSVHGDGTGAVVGNQQIFACGIDAGVDRTR